MALRIPHVDALNLASMLSRWKVPEPATDQLQDAVQRSSILSSLSDHLIDELGLNAETAERFDALATSPFYAERVPS
jgi:hypothetical protein